MPIVIAMVERGAGGQWVGLGLALAVGADPVFDDHQKLVEIFAPDLARPCRVLHVEGMAPSHLTQGQWSALSNSKRADVSLISADQCDGAIVDGEQVPLLDSAEGRAWLDHRLARSKARVLIMDGVPMLWSAQALGDVVTWLEAVADRLELVVIMHHACRRLMTPPPALTKSAWRILELRRPRCQRGRLLEEVPRADAHSHCSAEVFEADQQLASLRIEGGEHFKRMVVELCTKPGRHRPQILGEPHGTRPTHSASRRDVRPARQLRLGLGGSSRSGSGGVEPRRGSNPLHRSGA